MDVSVVVPAYNEAARIGRALKALSAQEPDEIIVVDNNSTDRTAQIARKYADKVLRQKKQGIGHSRNLGAASANNSTVAFLDADCIPGPRWVESIEQGLHGNTIGLVGPVLPQEQTLKHILASYLCWSVVSKTFLHLGYPSFHGGNCAYDQQIFLDLGGFRTDILPGEDVDMSLRFRKRGRLRFSQGMIVRASTRRFEKHGYSAEILRWARVFWKISTNQPWNYSYLPVR